MKYECVTDGYDNWYAVRVGFAAPFSVKQFQEYIEEMHALGEYELTTYPASEVMHDHPDWVVKIGEPLN